MLVNEQFFEFPNVNLNLTVIKLRGCNGKISPLDLPTDFELIAGRALRSLRSCSLCFPGVSDTEVDTAIKPGFFPLLQVIESESLADSRLIRGGA